MKLFSLPDGVIDRKDRAQWITPPFDLAFSTAVAAATVGLVSPGLPFWYSVVFVTGGVWGDIVVGTDMARRLTVGVPMDRKQTAGSDMGRRLTEGLDQ